MRAAAMATMRRTLRAGLLFGLLFGLLLGVEGAGAQATGKISGVIEDVGGKPVAGVAVTLSADAGSAGASAPSHATTDSEGHYLFSGVTYGRYHVSPDGAGSSFTQDGALTVSQAEPEIRADLTLAQAKAAGRGPQLQAAGIRGYIDPGGYSAPASAAAANDIVRGISDVKRADNSVSGAAYSCARQAELVKAVASHPDDASADFQVGEMYLAEDQPTQALPYLQRAFALDGADAGTRVALADAYLRNRQFQAAHDLLMQDAKVPVSVEGYRSMARADEGLGAFAEASQEYLAAARLQPSEDDFFGAGYELILAGTPDAGTKVFEAGVAQFPRSTILRMGIGTAAFLEGRSAEATRIFLEAVNLNPADPRPYPFLSASFRISGIEADAVRKSFRQFHELVPENADAAYFYGLSLLHHVPGDGAAYSAQAESLLQRAVQLNTGLDKAHVQLGSLYFEQERYAPAAAEFQAALQLDPNQWEIHYKLSGALKRLGKTQEADREMQVFVAHRNEQAAPGADSAINLEEFVSVFKPSQRAAGQAKACDASPGS